MDTVVWGTLAFIGWLLGGEWYNNEPVERWMRWTGSKAKKANEMEEYHENDRIHDKISKISKQLNIIMGQLDVMTTVLKQIEQKIPERIREVILP